MTDEQRVLIRKVLEQVASDEGSGLGADISDALIDIENILTQ